MIRWAAVANMMIYLVILIFSGFFAPANTFDLAYKYIQIYAYNGAVSMMIIAHFLWNRTP